MAIADSGTTGHFLQISSECTDKKQTNEGIRVKLPDGSEILSTHTAFLNIPQLPKSARGAHLFPDISHALLSISMLCDQGYMAIFDDLHVYIVKDGEVILHGNRDPATGLYMVNITPHDDEVKPSLDIHHMENLGTVKTSLVTHTR